MRHLLLALFMVCLLPLTGQESIKNFTTHLQVLDDGSIEVTEDITVIAAGDQIKRGITRALHRRGVGADAAGKRFEYEVLEVLRDGQEIKHSAKTEGRNRIHYLGSKSEKIPPGEYTFRFKYRSADQLYFVEQTDEIRWPFLGVDGSLPVEKGTITVTFPSGTQLVNSACYTGEEGSTAEDCRFEQGSSATTFTLTRPLAPGEGMTVSVGVAPGFFARPVPPPPPTPLQENGTLYLSLFGILAGLWYAYTSWRKYGVDPIGPEVRPRFSAPEGVSPAAASYLLSGYPSQQQLTASLTALAIKGYLRIEEEEKDTFLGLGSKEMFIISPTDKPYTQADLPPEQYVLLGQLQGYGNRLELDGTYNERLNKITTAYNKTLKNSHAGFLKDGSNYRHLWPLLGIGVVSICVAAFFLKYTSGAGIAAFAVLVMGTIFGSLFYMWLIRQPSLEKVTLKNEIKSLRDYLKLKEPKRKRLLNVPEMTEAHFQEMLPYAISFGVDNNWASDLSADWANTAKGQSRGNHHHYYPYYLPGFGHKLGGAYAGTAHRAASGGGGGGGFSGGGGSVGGGGGTGGF